MSLLELQRASMGPHRWIARSSSKERNPDGVLPHSVTWHLIYSGAGITYCPYLVPGGRYLFLVSPTRLVLWDLGSPYSSGRKPYIVASVPVKFCDNYLVHSTLDGMGLRVFLYGADDVPDNDSEDMTSLYIYEIYPARQLTQIAYLRIPGSRSKSFFSLSYDRPIFAHENVLTVWDYKANTWARWGIESEFIKIVTTKSAVALIHTYGVSVWEIPPLLPEPSLSMSTDPHVTFPAFEFYYPENDYYVYNDFHQAPCDWYSGSHEPLYYDVVESRGDNVQKINRFEIPPINSKTSGDTLNLLTTYEVQLNYSPREIRLIYQNRSSPFTTTSRSFLGTHGSRHL